MAASWVAICNEALISLGSQPIASLTEDSNNAKLCNSVYRTVVDECLVEHDWACAIERFLLTPIDYEGEAYSTDWMFAYQLPTVPFCLKILGTDPEVSWKREGQLMLANAEDLTLIYIKQITDPAEIEPALARAIAGKMAALLAPRISAKETALREQLGERDMLKARWADRQGGEKKAEDIEGEDQPDAWEEVT